MAYFCNVCHVDGWKYNFEFLFRSTIIILQSISRGVCSELYVNDEGYIQLHVWHPVLANTHQRKSQKTHL